MFDDLPTPDWWHDPVLLALDFTPVQECDALTTNAQWLHIGLSGAAS
jgi:hypothetical protein